MTNQEQYDLIWVKAKKYDRLVEVLDTIRPELEDVIIMLEVLKEQSHKSCKDTAVLDVNIDSFNFVIDESIKLLEMFKRSDDE